MTPDGNYLTVNEFLHPDLFWALRGGGGGTFGVVIESTIKVEPKMKLQVYVLVQPILFDLLTNYSLLVLPCLSLKILTTLEGF